MVSFSSLLTPTKSAFLTAVHGSGVNDINSSILVQNVDHLQKAAASTPASDEPFVFFDLPRKWILGDSHNIFGFFRRDAVPSDVLDIPFVPSEIHIYLCKKIAKESSLVVSSFA